MQRKCKGNRSPAQPRPAQHSPARPSRSEDSENRASSRISEGFGETLEGSGRVWEGSGRVWQGSGRIWQGSGRIWGGSGRIWEGIGGIWHLELLLQPLQLLLLLFNFFTEGLQSGKVSNFVRHTTRPGVTIPQNAHSLRFLLICVHRMRL